MSVACWLGPSFSFYPFKFYCCFQSKFLKNNDYVMPICYRIYFNVSLFTSAFKLFYSECTIDVLLKIIMICLQISLAWSHLPVLFPVFGLSTVLLYIKLFHDFVCLNIFLHFFEVFPSLYIWKITFILLNIVYVLLLYSNLNNYKHTYDTVFCEWLYCCMYKILLWHI